MQKKSISHIDVYGANGPKLDFFPNPSKCSHKFPNLYFCEIFELRPLENTQKINKWLFSL